VLTVEVPESIQRWEVFRFSAIRIAKLHANSTLRRLFVASLFLSVFAYDVYDFPDCPTIPAAPELWVPPEFKEKQLVRELAHRGCLKTHAKRGVNCR
jgi:hypothetical protein